MNFLPCKFEWNTFIPSWVLDLSKPLNVQNYIWKYGLPDALSILTEVTTNKFSYLKNERKKNHSPAKVLRWKLLGHLCCPAFRNLRCNPEVQSSSHSAVPASSVGLGFQAFSDRFSRALKMFPKFLQRFLHHFSLKVFEVSLPFLVSSPEVTL